MRSEGQRAQQPAKPNHPARVMGVCFQYGDEKCTYNSTVEWGEHAPGTPAHACPSCCTTMSTEGGGAVFSFVVQAALLLLGFASLLVKRKFEKPRRPQKVWAFDVSKQAASGICAHLMGMLNASIMNSLTNAAGGDQCSWYFIGFSLDTTVGLCFAYFGLKAVKCAPRPLAPPPRRLLLSNRLRRLLADKCGWPSLKSVGDYSTPPDTSIYCKQMVAWCIITIVARVFVLVVQLALVRPSPTHPPSP